jgi:hypothetical protein
MALQYAFSCSEKVVCPFHIQPPSFVGYEVDTKNTTRSGVVGVFGMLFIT